MDASRNMTDVVIKLLEFEPAEFSANVPFTAYGLDSLSAARLAFVLRPYVTISQLQLLSDISLHDLETRIEATDNRRVFEESPSTFPSSDINHTTTKL